MARTKRSSGRAITPATIPSPHPGSQVEVVGLPVLADAVFHVPYVHPTGPGPWADEPDKVAWMDVPTGYGCIIRRSPVDRHLCGYVSVPTTHPLFGRGVRTLGDVLVAVHGGLDYSAACQENEPEERSVCHVRGVPTSERIVPESFRQTIHGNEAAGHDDAWWFGFSCDQADDLTPTSKAGGRRDRLLDGVVEPTYKTVEFVYGECVRLARS